MKTIGERIRQAREKLGLSGDKLAERVGYKHQSAIGNLENRATGTGGNKIKSIADALTVPVEWLLSGPDSDDVPFLPANAHQRVGVKHTVIASESDSNLVSLYAGIEHDAWTLEVIGIMHKLPAIDRKGAVAALRSYVQNLGPPRDGQALSVAGQKKGATGKK